MMGRCILRSVAVKKLLSLLVGLTLIALATPAAAVLRVDITRGNVDPLPIAVPDFAGKAAELTQDGSTEEIGRNIAAVITNNLARSGLFRPVDPKAFIRIKEVPGGRRPGAGHRSGATAKRRPHPRRIPAVGRARRKPDVWPAILFRAAHLAADRAHDLRRHL
jgi:hypothetical protein